HNFGRRFVALVDRARECRRFDRRSRSRADVEAFVSNAWALAAASALHLSRGDCHNFTLPRPFLGGNNETDANRIFPNVLPLLCVTSTMPNEMIEEAALPMRQSTRHRLRQFS